MCLNGQMYSNLPNWVSKEDVQADEIDAKTVTTETLKAKDATIDNIHIEDVSLDDVIVNTLVVNSAATIPGYAKLNADNTFTGVNTFQNSGTTNTTLVKALMPNLSDNNYVALTLGRAESDYNSIRLKFTYKNNSNRVCDLGFYADADGYLKFDSGKHGWINGDLTLSNTLTVNNTNNPHCLELFNTGDVYMYFGKNESGNKKNRGAVLWRRAGEDSNDNHMAFFIQGAGDIFQMYPNKILANQPLTVNGQLNVNTTETRLINMFNSSLAAGSYAVLALGRNADTNYCATIRYAHNTGTRALGLGFFNNDDKLVVKSDGNVVVSNDLSASSVTIGNNTINEIVPSGSLPNDPSTLTDSQTLSAKAIYQLIQSMSSGVRFTDVYPVGSIYCTVTDLPGPHVFDNNTCYVEWNGCRWAPLAPQDILQNYSWIISGANTWEWDDTISPNDINTSSSSLVAYHVYMYRRIL